MTFCSKFSAESSSEKNFENRLLFRKVIDTSRVSCFFRLTVYMFQRIVTHTDIRRPSLHALRGRLMRCSLSVCLSVCLMQTRSQVTENATKSICQFVNRENGTEVY